MKRHPIDYKAVAREIKRFVPNGQTVAELAASLPKLGVELVTYDKGEFLGHIGDLMTRVYYVLSGRLHLCTEGADGSPLLMFVRAPGSFIGSSAVVLSQRQFPFSVLAYEPCRLLSYDCAKIRQWRQEPESAGLFAELERQSFENFDDVALKCAVLSQYGIANRVLTFLRMRCAHHGSKTIHLDFTMADLASYLGVNASALSRTLNQMKADGRIDYTRRQMTLLD